MPLRERVVGIVHTLLHTPALASWHDEIPRFFAQVDLVWKKMKIQYDERAVSEMNKELRYNVYLFRRFCSSDCIVSCDAGMCCVSLYPHIRSMVHRTKYGCDLSTSEEEQVDPMLEQGFPVLCLHTSVLALTLLFIRILCLKPTSRR